MMLNRKGIINSLIVTFISLSEVVFSQSAPPSKLQASGEGNIIKLSWEAPDTDQSVTYNIYRAEISNSSDAVDLSQQNYTKIGAVVEPAFEDKLESATEKLYVYYVASVNSNGVESAGSNYVKVTIGDTGTIQIDTYGN